MLNKKYKEVELIVENKRIPCVSSILCESNDTLNKMISDNNIRKRVILSEHITIKAFSLLCNYYGYGIIDVNEENVVELFICCICLNEMSLLSICQKYILSHLNNRIIIDIMNLIEKDKHLFSVCQPYLPPPPILESIPLPTTNSFNNPNIIYRITSSNRIKIGVELNYYTSSCSILKGDRIEDIICDNVSNNFPNYVYYDAFKSEISVGYLAESKPKSNQLIKYPMNIIGLNYSDEIVQNVIYKSSIVIVNDGGIPKYEIRFNNKTVYLSVKEVFIEIMKYIKRNIDEYFNIRDKEELDVEMSIPIELNDNQKQEIISSARETDIKVEVLIPTPITICAAFFRKYNIDDDKTEKLLIFELYYSQLQLSIIEMNYETKTMKVLSTEKKEIGSDMFIDRLVEYYSNKYKEETDELELDLKKKYKLRKLCEEVISILDDSHVQNIDCDFLVDEGIDTNLSITTFKHICKDLFNSIYEGMESILRKCRLSEYNLKRIILKNDSQLKALKCAFSYKYKIKMFDVKDVSSINIEKIS